MSLTLLVGKIMARLRHIYLLTLGSWLRRMKAPALPKNHDKVLLHIGCGEINDRRFINLDARPLPHVHFVTKSLDLEQFTKSSVDLIYACHVLEHISHLEVVALLTKWHHKLKDGGIVRISVPDFDRIIAIYQAENSNIQTILPALMGGQDYPTNYHYVAFNHAFLGECFRRAGFAVVRAWDPATADYHGFNDWSKLPLEIAGKKYPISLNLEAVK